jgi:hypothetical protein
VLQLSKTTEGIIEIAVGLYIIIAGLTSKILISESDIPATEEEKLKATATPARRIAITIIGLIACGYGVYRLLS